MKKRLQEDYKYLIPISIIVFLVPLIVYMKVVELSNIEIQLWKGESNNADFFTYYKMMALNLLTWIGVVCTIFYFNQNKLKIKKTNIYKPMVIYLVCIILSTIFAEYKTVALFGFVERYEGMFSLVSYIILMFIGINLVNDEKSIKGIIYPLLGGAVIIGTIGIFQYIGKDLFQTSFMKKLMLPMAYKDQADSLSFSFGKNTIYSTLYNSNYVGSYMVLIAPLTLTILILSKDRRMKLAFGALTGLMFFNLVGSNSRGGIIGTAFAVLILLVFLRKEIFKNWKMVGLAIGILLIGFLAINKISDGRTINQMTRLKNDIKTILVSGEKNRDEYQVEDLIAKDGRLEIKTTEESLNIEYDDGRIKFLDENNEEIPIEYNRENGLIEILDEKYGDYVFKLFDNDGVIVLDMTLKEYNTKFALKDDEFKYFLRNDVIWDIERVESFGFEGKEMLGSGRGYIWSRSIPMLKETSILGKGPDTYAIYFPQGDFVGRMKAKFQQGNIVDKPHNLYLQIGINTGIISLLAFLSIIGMYFIQSIKVYFNSKFDNPYEIFGLGIFVSIAGYMVTSIFNDSVVSIAPIFWILLGTGVSINMNLLNLRKKI